MKPVQATTMVRQQLAWAATRRHIPILGCPMLAQAPQPVIWRRAIIALPLAALLLAQARVPLSYLAIISIAVLPIGH
jgi:hypothetical protein